MESQPPQGNAIITAEQAPDIGESGTARYFCMELYDGMIDLRNLSSFQREAENGTLRSCMLAYTEWIKTRFLKDKDTERSFVNQLKKSFHNYRQEFINSGIRCHGRVPEIYAWLMIGMEYFLSFLFEHDAISEEEYQATFIQCRDCLYELAKKQSSSIEQDEAFSISKNGLIKALAEEGMTICDKGKNTKSIRLGDKTLRFICLIKDKADAVAALAQ
jgi:hypothetical protein